MRRSSMAHTAKNFQGIMDQTVMLPGFGEIIVSRGWLYQFLSSRGWNRSERGFGSLDYIVFSSKATDSVATPDSIRDSWIAEIEAKDDPWTRPQAVQQ